MSGPRALTRYDTTLKAPRSTSKNPFDGDALGPDFNLGIELRRQGYKNYVDYSVAVEHCKPDGTSIHPRLHESSSNALRPRGKLLER